MHDDPFDLSRFVDAQSGTYDTALAELRAGRKRSHWMWFIFPQPAGLGFSAMSQRYAIASLTEARAYLAHPVLGPRLLDCTRLVLAADGSIATILGAPDDMKFHSSMTLFGEASDEPVFTEALARFFAGTKDRATLDLLARPRDG